MNIDIVMFIFSLIAVVFSLLSRRNFKRFEKEITMFEERLEKINKNI